MDELIKALRKTPTQTYCDAIYDECDYCNNAREAADAIERLIAEIDRKDKALQAWVDTWENAKCKLIENICQHCDTTPEEKLKDGCCEECPIVSEIKAVFDNGDN